LRKKKEDTLIHIIGVGGIGMSALAEILVRLGFKVQGSDLSESANVLKLRSIGVDVKMGHRKENISDANVVFHSSAVKQDNPEYEFALAQNIPVLRRAELLADIMRLQKGIAVAGTHGKTTTTSIVATLLKEVGLDPTYIIGGIVHNLGGHAHVGKGEYIVAEADESDGSFLMLNPIASIITNIDSDHLDHYGSMEGLVLAFESFANQIPFYGVCAINAHDPILQKISSRMNKPFVTFAQGELEQSISRDEVINYHARNVSHSSTGAIFDLYVDGEKTETFKLNSPGRHNVLNALGALSVAIELGHTPKELVAALSKFEGVGRRFQKVFEEANFEIIDDYAHHPTEIFETIKTAKESRKDKEVCVIFEPHRFTRTKACWADFLHCFNLADKVLIAPIYPANELPIQGINTESLVSDINKLHPGLCESFQEWSRVEEFIESHKSKKTILLALGAGAVGKKVKSIVGKS
jgi:UDP-N-acetylmuramate--alanine ligase